MSALNQGDIIKIENIKVPVVVVSKNMFNTSNEIIGCPIFPTVSNSPLHIWIKTKDFQGEVQCEKLSLFDMSVRGYKKVSSVPIESVINITNVIQSIFDYI